MPASSDGRTDHHQYDQTAAGRFTYTCEKDDRLRIRTPTPYHPAATDVNFGWDKPTFGGFTSRFRTRWPCYKPPVRRFPLVALVVLLWAACAVGSLGAGQGPSRASANATAFMPVDAVMPGMIGTGRTVYAGEKLEDFKVEIIGTMSNITGPARKLILAKLSGGPVDQAGVIAGMSGSPVYIGGKLVGAVSYALGSFPKEPIAGITPIGEMLTDIDTPTASRPASGDFALGATATPDQVFAALRRVFTRASGGADLMSPVSAAPYADGMLRPIGAALSIRGFDSTVAFNVSGAFGDHAFSDSVVAGSDNAAQGAPPPSAALRPGDAVGASLMRGDFEMGATGTVTFVDGDRIYAFGHPFLGLGPTRMPMTRARVYTVLPSLQSSMKIADLGPAIGTISQDRATAIGGSMGAKPPELEVGIKLVPAIGPERKFSFHVTHDPALTPLFAYVSMLNVLSSYHKQQGALTIGINATASFGADGRVAINDLFSGDQALVGVANSVLGPMTAMMSNNFKQALPDRLDITLNVSETEGGMTIERAWLDTTQPRYGATHTLHVMLKNLRGQTETRSVPVTMPSAGPSQLTLLVADAPTLANLEDKELDPNVAHSLPDLVTGLNRIRRNNKLYVRLIESAAGSVVAGRAQPSLPGSTRSVIDADKSSAPTLVNRASIAEWDQTFNVVVRGSKEVSLTLMPAIR